jgi:outer membrane biosynthesis protein TonB
MSVVNKYINDIHRCYERALMDDSNLSGRVEYEWNISPNGAVSAARVKGSEMSNSDSLNKCVLAIFYKMKFPTAKNGQPTIANIGFPFGKL